MNLDFVIVRFVIYIHLISLLVAEPSPCLFSNWGRFLIILGLDVTFKVTIFFFSDLIFDCREKLSFKRLVTNSELEVLWRHLNTNLEKKYTHLSNSMSSTEQVGSFVYYISDRFLLNTANLFGIIRTLISRKLEGSTMQ